MPDGFISLWKNDWHGVAWVDAVGSPEPDLYVTRGALTGLLLPPFDPKTDHFWGYKGGVPLYEQVSEAMLGPDYCRGRQTAWFDLDNDGSNELYLSCTETENRLLDDEGAGFVDRAPELGLNHVEPDAFAIFDVDGDACLDVVHNDLAELVVHLREGDAFVENPGPDWPEPSTPQVWRGQRPPCRHRSSMAGRARRAEKGVHLRQRDPRGPLEGYGYTTLIL